MRLHFINIFAVFFFLTLFSCDKNRNVTSSNLLGATVINNDYFLPKSTTGVVIRHRFYTLSYAEKHEQAEWVAYELKKNDIVRANFKRPYFIEDPKVPTRSALVGKITFVQDTTVGIFVQLRTDVFPERPSMKLFIHLI